MQNQLSQEQCTGAAARNSLFGTAPPRKLSAAVAM
jgi:hypothetical protein